MTVTTIHDFRSDTVTLPTPAMMEAIARARLGDAARGDDPTVNELEALARELTGKDDALFLPSGTMANLSALLAHDCRGGEVIVEERAHVYNAEGGGLSALAGAVPRPLRGEHGALDPADVAAAMRRGAAGSVAPTRLVCVENSHNAAGGAVLPLANLQAIHEAARRAGVPVHLDGARLHNAAAWLDVPIAAICMHADSVWFALCKGLGAPIGAVLAGDRPFMARARGAARMLGGGMRQAGLVAAPALIALRDPFPQLRHDHERALALARGLAGIDPALVAPERVQTNIVNCHVERFATDAAAIGEALRARGILVNHRRTMLRFVTHRHIDDASVQAAIGAVAEVVAHAREAHPHGERSR